MAESAASVAGCKRCSACGQEKPLEDFNRCKRMGRQRWCRECSHLAANQWKRENRRRVALHNQRYRDRRHEAVAARKRAEHERDPSIKAEAVRKYAERYPERIAAHKAIANRVQRGQIIKPSNCEDCGIGVEAPGDLHAHHHDYSKPLEVEWLCRTCHGRRHRVIQEESGA